KINPITDTNLLTFIRTSCSTASNTVSDSQFTKALERGMFIFILDGFDELNTEIRDKIQENIFEIRSKYPKNSLILSSRPDERFGSWNEFNIYSISKLTKEKCLNLINELPYDKGVKKRFYDKVKNELYDEYRDFLVYPLLVSIMLLTFEECAHIPNKITEFYNQAFDTLFYKHDALKEQYKRKFYTALTKDEFKLCFSAFCSIGYLNQKYAFTEELIKEYTEKSLNYSSTITPSMKNRSNVDNFIKDMTESVCLIQKDGLEYSFVHRSFQEYFTAIFISKTNNDNKVKLLNKFYKRKNDSVIPMAFELDRENIEKLWILPSLKSSLSELEDLIDNKKVEKYIESISVIVNVIEKEILFSINYNDNHISFIDTAEKLFSENKKNRKQNFLYQFFNEKSCIIFKENDLLKSENIINVKILKNIEETMKRFYSK
ncbi:NACHT domain-containing NTPase, partial [Acetobacter malorum]|uniref:NACHT domain-containing protein n=1 Tax=Acetobacter malorum TaxID=178901 RepID=UPI0018D47E1F